MRLFVGEPAHERAPHSGACAAVPQTSLRAHARCGRNAFWVTQVRTRRRPVMQGVAPEVSAQRACERSGERGRGAASRSTKWTQPIMIGCARRIMIRLGSTRMRVLRPKHPVLKLGKGSPKVPQGGGRYSLQKGSVRTYFTVSTDHWKPLED